MRSCMEHSPHPPAPLPKPRSFDLLARLRAAGIHLGLCLLVALLAAALVFGIWYPIPFREISGGRQLFTLVVSVDVALGPLITFAIFNRRKPRRELRRDLTIVALLQLAGLAYGLHTVWLARPVYLVFEVDRFRAVRAIDVNEAELGRAAAPLNRLPMWGPRIIAARSPSGKEDVFKSIELALAGRDIGTRPEMWQPYEAARSEVIARAKPLLVLRQSLPAHAAAIDAATSAAGKGIERLGYLPILARASSWVAVVDKDSAAVVGYLPFGGF
jgi:hypothetical protein